MQTYMAEMIRERQVVVDKVERHDLLSSLLEANDHDLDLETLTENEIISMLHILHLNVDLVITNVPGNIYVFLVAGHEVCNLHFPAAFLIQEYNDNLVRQQHIL